MPKPPYAADLKHYLNNKWRQAREAHLDGRMADAARLYRQVLELTNYESAPQVASKAAIMCWHFKDTDRARRLLASCLARYEAVLAKGLVPEDPEYADHLYNAGKFEQDSGNVAGAVTHYEAAIAARLLHGKEPRVESLANLGLAYLEQGRDVEAEVLFDEALAVDAGSAESLFNRAFVKLMRGDASGWADYEARSECASFQWSHERSDLTLPQWKGEALWPGAVLLLHTEQGFGDVIQFARFVPRVRAMVPDATVRLEVPAELLRLFRSAWPDLDIIARGLPVGACDVTASLLSLPAVTGMTFDDVPPPVPFGLVEPAADNVRLLAMAGDRPRVGLCWAGSKEHPNDARRSLSGDLVRALVASVPGICWYSLQVGDREADVPVDAPCAPNSTFVRAPAVQDFGDTAQLMRHLDVVVSVDSAVAHLAGSLRVPTLTLLQHPSEWRWMRDRADSPWYPSMRLMRQQVAGDWWSVLDTLARTLNATQEGLAA